MGMLTMGTRPFVQQVNKLVEEEKVFKSKLLALCTDGIRAAHRKLDPALQENDVIDICVSYDGTWQKRGHMSLWRWNCN